ncbi:MAG: hypothetical protein A3F10_06325 [Coxiella sp. RIFCSPHIGHO2_12_FULL_42_15]|nr:MAG: hypothetical protein A3F10_06325 [Coxiella sp. RIFCSPHIGHO2_12_FULL_42_15]
MGWQGWTVFLFATLVMFYVQRVYPFFHPGGDSDGNIFIARHILHLPGGAFISSHGPGMALFLILTGVVPFNTWKLMMAAYAAMSVAMPCLLYSTLRLYSKYGAFLAALIIIMSGIPYAYSRVDSYDHLFLFLEFFTFFLIARYFYDARQYAKYLYFIVILFATMNLVKPLAAFLLIVFFSIVFFLSEVTKKNLVKAMCCYFAIMGLWVVFDRGFSVSSYPEWNQPDNLLQRRFAETYYQPSHYLFTPQLLGKPVVSQQDGPASNALYQAIIEYVHLHKNDLVSSLRVADIPKQLPYSLFGKYAHDPESLVKTIFQFPNAFYFNFIRKVVKEKWGRSGDGLLYLVAVEHGNTGFLGMVNYLWHYPSKLLTGPVVSMGWRNLLAVFSFAPLREQADFNILVRPQSVLQSLVRPDFGPYSGEFYAALRFFAREIPVSWQNTNYVFNRFSDPEILYNAILNFKAEPVLAASDLKNKIQNGDMTIVEGWYYTNFLGIYGPVLSSELFRRVVGEIISVYPSALFLFADNFLKEAFSFRKVDISSSLLNYDYRYFSETSPINYSLRVNDFTNLGPQLSAQLQHEIYPDKHSRFIAAAYSFIHYVSPWFSWAALFFFSFAILGRARYFALFLIGAYGYFVAVMTVFGNFGSDRYSDMFLWIPLMIVMLGFSSIFPVWKILAQHFNFKK